MKTEAARAAAAIRKELKAAFPEIQFSVKSETYSGGDAVRIHYYDGPKTDAVDAITNKYQYGSFDGMTDMYNNDNCRDDIPQAKWIQVSRSMSAKSEELAGALLASEYGITDDATCFAFLGCWLNTAKWRLFNGVL